MAKPETSGTKPGRNSHKRSTLVNSASIGDDGNNGADPTPSDNIDGVTSNFNGADLVIDGGALRGA